jgi:hypothetical protein
MHCRYGVSRQNERYLAEIKDLYASYVRGILPPGNEDLKGDEVEQIIAFKNALGLDDPDAAAMHIEVQFFTFFLAYVNCPCCTSLSGNSPTARTHPEPYSLWPIICNLTVLWESCNRIMSVY